MDMRRIKIAEGDYTGQDLQRKIRETATFLHRVDPNGFSASYDFTWAEEIRYCMNSYKKKHQNESLHNFWHDLLKTWWAQRVIPYTEQMRNHTRGNRDEVKLVDHLYYFGTGDLKGVNEILNSLNDFGRNVAKSKKRVPAVVSNFVSLCIPVLMLIVKLAESQSQAAKS